MTNVPSPISPDDMSQKERKSRYRRAERQQQTYTTEQDRTLLLTLFTMRFAATSSLLVALAPHRNPGGVTRRLRNLFDAGLIDRLNRDGMASFGGTKEPIYYIGTGAAAEVDETRPAYSRLTAEEVQEKVQQVVRPKYVPRRDWRAGLLEEALGIDRKVVAALLDRNEDIALKIVTQQGQSNIKHFLFISSIVSLFRLAEQDGAAFRIADLRTDGAVKTRVLASAASPSLRAYAVGSGPDAYFPIEPDGVMVLEQNGERHAIILEAETGTQSGNKIGPKLANYLVAHEADAFDNILATAGIDPVDSVRVLIVSGSAQHFNMSMATLHDVKPSGSGLFVFGYMGRGGIEYAPGSVPAESIKNDWRIDEFAEWKKSGAKPDSTRKNGDAGDRMLAVMRKQLASPIFRQLRDVPAGTERSELAQFARTAVLLS